MQTFVRIAHRQGWDVEVIRNGEIVEVLNRSSREEALALGRSLAPDWMEIGEMVGPGTPAQRHSWTTLRRQPDGSYSPSPLRWAPARQADGPGAQPPPRSRLTRPRPRR